MRIGHQVTFPSFVLDSAFGSLEFVLLDCSGVFVIGFNVLERGIEKNRSGVEASVSQ